MIRILGIEFSPLRSDATHPSNTSGKTGYELGLGVGIRQSGVSSHCIYKAMGMSPDSLDAHNFGDTIKFGEPQAYDFIRDFLAGYVDGNTIKKDAHKNVEKFNLLCGIMGNLAVVTPLYGTEWEDNLESAFGKSDFLLKMDVKSEEGEPTSASARRILSSGFSITGGKIHAEGVSYDFDREQEFNEETLRCISRVFSHLLNPFMLQTVDDLMYEQFRAAGYEALRAQIDQAAESWCADPASIKNVYLKN